MRQHPLILSLTVAAVLTGCGDRSDITGGGTVEGDALTVYVLAPFTPQGRDLVRGAKLALRDAGGRSGRFSVQFAAQPEPATTEGIADAVREIVVHQDTIAVIGDLDPRTAQISAPLLNAAGILHVSPIAPTTVEQPAAQRTFFATGRAPADEAAAIVARATFPIAVEFEPGGEALADAIRARAGRTVPTRRARTVVYAGSDPVNAGGTIAAIRRENPRARVIRATGMLAPERAGYAAMKAVLAALDRAGGGAANRTRVIAAFRPPSGRD